VPQIERHRGERQQKSANQERASRPVDPIEWDSKLQKESVLGIRSSQHHVSLGPAMHRATMRAANFLLLHFGRFPEGFLYRLASVGQFGGRRATHQHALHVRVAFGLRFSRRIK